MFALATDRANCSLALPAGVDLVSGNRKYCFRIRPEAMPWTARKPPIQLHLHSANNLATGPLVSSPFFRFFRDDPSPPGPPSETLASPAVCLAGRLVGELNYQTSPHWPLGCALCGYQRPRDQARKRCHPATADDCLPTSKCRDKLPCTRSLSLTLFLVFYVHHLDRQQQMHTGAILTKQISSIMSSCGTGEQSKKKWNWNKPTYTHTHTCTR